MVIEGSLSAACLTNVIRCVDDGTDKGEVSRLSPLNASKTDPVLR